MSFYFYCAVSLGTFLWERKLHQRKVRQWLGWGPSKSLSFREKKPSGKKSLKRALDPGSKADDVARRDIWHESPGRRIFIVVSMIKDVIRIFVKNEKHVEFLSYFFFAGVATVVDFSLLYSLTEFAGLWYLLSATISYIFGMITNYSLNKIYTFENKSRKIVRQFGVFMFVATIGLVLNNLIMYGLVEYFGLWYMFARFISMFIVLIWSFSGHKYITFGKFIK